MPSTNSSALKSLSLSGRRPESIVDIEETISEIFTNHPEAHFNNSDIPVIPAHSLPDVILELSARYEVEVLSKDEQRQMELFVQDNPSIEVTPELLLSFVAQVTAKHSKSRTSPTNSSPEHSDRSDRGRDENRQETNRSGGMHSRSSSRDSKGNPYWKWEQNSSFGPPDSPFEAKSRQRSTPLAGPPSSWNRRPAPATRRKSDAGNQSGSMSDTEYSFVHQRETPRTRAPSTPSSPTAFSPEAHSSSLPAIRPHSRAQSHSNFSLDFGVRQFKSRSPQDGGLISPPPDRDRSFSPELITHIDPMLDGVSSLPMPRSHDSDSDDDHEDSTHRVSDFILDHERSIAASAASLAPQDRLDALSRANEELARKVMEAERSLQHRMTDHEVEIEELQSKLDELKSELTATKREEKELRNKERQNMQQIQLMEAEISKLQKSLENSKALYQNLNKQYIEQCSESEKLRNSLRQKDQDIKALEETKQLHELELFKWNQQRESLETAHSITEQELVIARHAQAELDDQKQENLVLKETIDRLRFDLDELRTREHAVPAGHGSASSQFNTISKSLGAELMSRWDSMDQDDEVTEEEEKGEALGSDGEEMIQTIITRKKRKINTKRPIIEMSDSKEYTDSYTQYDVTEFVSSCGIQTDEEPKRSLRECSTQSEPERKPVVHSLETQTIQKASSKLASVEIEIQTDPDPELSSTKDFEEDLTSSSSTIRPSTPRPPVPLDAPPSYDQTFSREVLRKVMENRPLDYSNVREPLQNELRIAEATLRHWHEGLKLPFEGLPEGISFESVEQWESLKKELGAGCTVIDKIIESSKKNSKSSPVPSPPKPAHRHRFYNIYNTYFYNKNESSLTSYAGPVLFGIFASTAVFLALSPISPYVGPGMPTYQDRAYWTAFNSLDAVGEGISLNQGDAMWSVLGRLLLGGAEVVRRANMPS
ncbi:hypothetical protein Clacol_002569 [Clathrus columnatus]|uniref:Uncharacterized protein n=1 Tax=Clathrus columnatus TaxID=1419009 RepID=A0AAV5A274_9AGAM|nr:hypothetical protein Clacol_002569 [Clathrus columnatus]